MVIYNWFTSWKWWCSIAMLVYQRAAASYCFNSWFWWFHLQKLFSPTIPASVFPRYPQSWWFLHYYPYSYSYPSVARLHPDWLHTGGIPIGGVMTTPYSMVKCPLLIFHWIGRIPSLITKNGPSTHHPSWLYPMFQPISLPISPNYIPCLMKVYLNQFSPLFSVAFDGSKTEKHKESLCGSAVPWALISAPWPNIFTCEDWSIPMPHMKFGMNIHSPGHRALGWYSGGH